MTAVVGLTPCSALVIHVGQFVAVSSDRSAQLDIGVFHPGRQLPDHGVVAAFFSLLDDDLEAETLTGAEDTNRALVQLDGETHADRCVIVSHR